MLEQEDSKTNEQRDHRVSDNTPERRFDGKKATNDVRYRIERDTTENISKKAFVVNNVDSTCSSLSS